MKKKIRYEFLGIRFFQIDGIEYFGFMFYVKDKEGARAFSIFPQLNNAVYMNSILIPKGLF